MDYQPDNHNTAAGYLIMTILASGLNLITQTNVTFCLSLVVSFMAIRYYYYATKKNRNEKL